MTGQTRTKRIYNKYLPFSREVFSFELFFLAKLNGIYYSKVTVREMKKSERSDP